jgi:hypothetical protein
MKSILESKVIAQGSKNVVIQVNGGSAVEFNGEWQMIVTLADLNHDPHYLRVDAVYHAISEGLEIQLAWKSKAALQPLMPLAGRGRLDFSEVSGVHCFLTDDFEGIQMRVMGVAKNASPSLCLILDLSKHQGALE